MDHPTHYTMNAPARAGHIRSLTERIEGKTALIRRPMMGKRADYSARVILADNKSH